MKTKKVKLELNKETIQVMEKNELAGVQGGQEYTSKACIEVIKWLLTITAGGTEVSAWNCPDDGETKGSQVVDENGCWLCEVVIEA